MRPTLERWLDAPRAPLWAAAVSLVLGLFFVFVRAPHPWGWQGIDQYHELARALARGEPFGTTDVPWGYAWFVAACYALFGERPWIPVTLQVLANATVPLLLYQLVGPLAGARTGALAAWLVGIFSFNTIYASTLASDALCTVLFLASLVWFGRGERRRRSGDFALSGLLCGLAAQFRPNLILFPILLAASYVVRTRRSWQPVVHISIFLTVVVLALSPWIVRNYRLTGRILPTSTHGGVQLWYGSLQVGPYLESRAYNPRSIFESSSFDYTSLAGDSIIVNGVAPACAAPGSALNLVYWTDRASERRRIPARPNGGHLTFAIPGQSIPTTIYYYLEVTWTTGDEHGAALTPLDGDANPFVYFVSDNHLGDLDRHDDLLDVFDLVRMVRHVAWREPLQNGAAMNLDRTNQIDARDVRLAVIALLGDGATEDQLPDTFFESSDDRVQLRLSDGSTFGLDRRSGARVTDLEIQGALAGALVSSRRPWRSRPTKLPSNLESCQFIMGVGVNEVFYRREVHQMNRYVALAFDNIARGPAAFMAAFAYRMGRLFILRGADDRRTAQQFAGSRLIYTGGLLLSIAYLIVFLAGVAIALKRRSPLRVLLLPIVYVPLTISVVLTNMRYTITVQPVMFAFMALASAAACGLDAGGRDQGKPAK